MPAGAARRTGAADARQNATRKPALMNAVEGPLRRMSVGFLTAFLDGRSVIVTVGGGACDMGIDLTSLHNISHHFLSGYSMRFFIGRFAEYEGHKVISQKLCSA